MTAANVEKVNERSNSCHILFLLQKQMRWLGCSRVYLLKERDAPSEVQIKQVMVSVGEKLDVDLSEVKR